MLVACGLLAQNRALQRRVGTLTFRWLYGWVGTGSASPCASWAGGCEGGGLGLPAAAQSSALQHEVDTIGCAGVCW